MVPPVEDTSRNTLKAEAVAFGLIMLISVAAVALNAVLS